MQGYKEKFEGKKVTVIGLGLLGGGLKDILFLLKNGAEITVTDLKSEKELKPSVEKIKKFISSTKFKIGKIRFVLGRHELEDFKNTDFILQPGNVPENSPFLTEARKNKIPIFVSESLFAKYEPGVIMIGITGTRGKSMTTALIYEILSKNIKNKKIFLAGNVRDVSTLALLEKVKRGDIVVMELDSWALHGMGDIKKSPNISVFTSFMSDHMNYYNNSMKKYFLDKANIFKYQNKNDVFVTSKEILKLIKNKPLSKIILSNKNSVLGWKFIVPGDHQKQNLSYAVEVAKYFNIPIEKIKNTVAKFEGIEGRLQLLKIINGIKIYNDNNATTPEAAIAGIKALVSAKQDLARKKIVLICGGSDKKLLLGNFVGVINKYCKAVIMIPGTGTDRLVSSSRVLVASKYVKDLKEAVKEAKKQSKKGDVILFSPAFASFGQFNNEYERNDLFIKLVKNL